MKLLLLSDLNSIHTKKWVKRSHHLFEEVLIIGFQKLAKKDFYSEFKNVKINSININPHSFLKEIQYLKNVKQIKKLSLNFKPDVLHAHYATSYGLIGTFYKY